MSEMPLRIADNRPTNPASPGKRPSSTGLDRVSCSWRDAVGPGFATGVSQRVADTLAVLGSGRYCR